MPNLAQALRDEIRRLAKKEIRRSTASMKEAVVRYRRDIAELKRRVADLERRLAVLQKEEKRRLAKKAPAELADGARFSPRWLKAHRERLGLSAADYARLIGVHPITIYSWEHGKTRPRKRQLAALVALRELGKREIRARLELLGATG